MMDAPSTLELRNLPDRLADHLVIMIARGELKPGQRIYEKEICEVQKVSRIPVREALRLLQAQGVVRTEPNRGTYVTEFTSDEMYEMLEIRLAVERIALRRILDRGTPKPHISSHFAGVLNAMRRAATLKDRLAYCQADLSFHNHHRPLLWPGASGQPGSSSREACSSSSCRNNMELSILTAP